MVSIIRNGDGRRGRYLVLTVSLHTITLCRSRLTLSAPYELKADYVFSFQGEDSGHESV